MVECDKLYELYWHDGLTLAQVGQYYGRSGSTIGKWMEHCGIQRRGSGDYTRKCPGCDTLRHLYWDEGMSTTSIAKKYDCTAGVVRKNMQRCGIDLRPPGRPLVDYGELAEMYESMSVREIANSLGACQVTVARALDRLGIPRVRGKHHMHPLPEFFKYESAELYYIVGLLFADGNINDKGAVTVSQKDPTILYEIGSLLDRPVREEKHSYILTLGGRATAQWLLENFDVGPRKSKTLRWPFLPRRFERDFVRGFFDGDGSIWFGRMSDGKLRRHVSFTCGSSEFLYELRAVLCRQGISYVRIHEVNSQRGSAHRLIYGGKARTAQFYDYMYYPACLCIDRKRAVFEEAIHNA